MAKLKKSECESAIRTLCHEWRRLSGNADTPEDRLSFSAFHGWVQQNYSQYLRFRTTTSVEYDVEMWFDQEFKQTGRR